MGDKDEVKEPKTAKFKFTTTVPKSGSKGDAVYKPGDVDKFPFKVAKTYEGMGFGKIIN